MKKRMLLMSVMIVALMCLLAISAFAEEIISSKTESDEYGTIIQLNADPGLDNAKQYVSTLKKINDAGTDKESLCILTDGTYFYVFPSSYVVNEREDDVFDITATDLASAIQEFNTQMTTGYYEAYVITGSGASKRLDNIVRFEFPSDVTSVSGNVCCMQSYPKLLEVRITNPTDLSSATKMFMSCNVLERLILPTNITEIPSYMFFGVGTKASTPFTIQNLSECTQLTTIGEDAFRDSGKMTIAIPDSVTTIGTRAFQSGCKNGSVTIGENSKLQTIGESAFQSCTAIKTFYIASTVTSIGASAFDSSSLTALENFENCQITVVKENTFKHISGLRTIKIPATVTTIENAFVGTKVLTTVYIPKSVTSIADTFVDGTVSWGYVQPTNAVYIYTGSNASVLSACSRLAGATVINAENYVETNSYTGVNLVVGYSHCKVYGHDYKSTGDCMDGLVCELCLDSLEGAKEHTYYETLTYVSLTANGTYTYGCSNEGCTNYDIFDDKVAPVFTAKGYSTNPDRNAINGGYEVNPKSLALYERLIGELKYGIVIANANSFGENTFFDENNKVNSAKALQVEMDKQYSSFDCSINFGTNTGVELDLIITAYVISDDGVIFIQKDSGSDVTIGGTSFKSITLASVVALVPAVSKEN